MTFTTDALLAGIRPWVEHETPTDAPAAVSALMAKVAAEARDHDPHLALFSGDDGLDAMRVLERRAALLLRPGGVVGAEHADLQGESAPAVFTAAGRWTEVRDHEDLAGRPRYLTARLAR